MNFVSKRYIVKIPSEICVIYSKKKNLLLIKTANKKKLIRLNVRVLILKEKGVIIVTNSFLKPFSSKFKSFSKTIQSFTVSQIKQSFLDVQICTYKKLKLVGVGYKVFEEQINGNSNILQFKLGYSHSLYYKTPSNIKTQINQSTKLFLSGYGFLKLSQCASTIRQFKKPEPYKGKGILYSNEIIKIKEGKKV